MASSGSKFSKFLRDNRALSGMTQSDAAKELGVTRATVNRWENSPAETCPLQVLDKAAKLFGVTAAQAINEGSQSQISSVARQAAREAVQEALISRELPGLSPSARTVAASLSSLDESELADVADFIQTIIRNRSSEPSSKSKKLR